jgi:cell division protein FtsB
VSDGHRTSTIPRPRHDDSRAVDRDDRDDRTSSRGRLDDYTTPIPVDKQLVPQRRGRLVIGVFGLLIALAIGAALFVLPVKSWMKQNSDISVRRDELATLDAANQQLQAEVERLQTDAGIKEAAREELDYVEAGEQRISVLPVGPATAVLPDAWPFNVVTRIIALRGAELVAATSVAPPTTG